MTPERRSNRAKPARPQARDADACFATTVALPVCGPKPQIRYSPTAQRPNCQAHTLQTTVPNVPMSVPLRSPKLSTPIGTTVGWWNFSPLRPAPARDAPHRGPRRRSILQAEQHDPAGRSAASRVQPHQPGTGQLTDYVDIPVAASKERDRIRTAFPGRPAAAAYHHMAARLLLGSGGRSGRGKGALRPGRSWRELRPKTGLRPPRGEGSHSCKASRHLLTAP